MKHFDKSMNIILLAAQFAAKAHKGQTRKYNGRPYISHPARVAGRVAVHPLATEDMVAAAFLHDVVEDTNATLFDDLACFAPKIKALIEELTNPSKGMKAPRQERKRIDREHIAGASREAKIIKLLDRIDNLAEMSVAPDDFKKMYADESRLLAEAIGDADLDLRDELLALVEKLDD